MLLECRMAATNQGFEETEEDLHVLFSDDVISEDADQNKNKNDFYGVCFWRSEDRVIMPDPYTSDTYIYNRERQIT